MLEGRLWVGVERGGGLSCRRGARIALTPWLRSLGRPCGGLVGPSIRRASCALHEDKRHFMFMAATTNRRWQALRSSPR